MTLRAKGTQNCRCITLLNWVKWRAIFPTLRFSLFSIAKFIPIMPVHVSTRIMHTSESKGGSYGSSIPVKPARSD